MIKNLLLLQIKKIFRPRLRGNNLKHLRLLYSNRCHISGVSVPDYGELILNWMILKQNFLFRWPLAGFRPRLRGTNLKHQRTKVDTIHLLLCFRPRLRGTNLKPC